MRHEFKNQQQVNKAQEENKQQKAEQLLQKSEAGVARWTWFVYSSTRKNILDQLIVQYFIYRICDINTT